jgi:hypothetical protein
MVFVPPELYGCHGEIHNIKISNVGIAIFDDGMRDHTADTVQECH